MDVLEQIGEDTADGTVVFLGVSGLLPSVLQGQAQYGQIVVSSLKLDPDSAARIEPLRHAANQCIRIGLTIVPVGGLPDVGELTPARLDGRNDSLDGVVNENDFLIRKTEEFVCQVVDLLEFRPLILSKAEWSIRGLDHPIDRGDQCVCGRLGPFALRHVVR